METTGPLAGRVALVTGVSRRIGIGMELARRMLADGASVFATGWVPHDQEMPWGADEGGQAAILESLGGAGQRLFYRAADLEQPEVADQLVAETIEQFGGIDLVIATHARSSTQSLSELTVLELDRCWAANVRSILLIAQSLASRREVRAGGRLVFFTSGQHIGPMHGEIPYAVTKGALHQMTATLAEALSDRGFTVNCINPGPVDTGYASGKAHAQVARMFPAGRWGQPEDVANLVAWLATDEAAWITGQVLNSEGGFRRWARVDLDLDGDLDGNGDGGS